MLDVRQEFEVLLDAAEDGRLGPFQQKRDDFIQSFAEFFEVEASRLLDKGRMNKPRPLRPEDMNVPSRLRFLANKALRDVESVQTALQLAKNDTSFQDAQSRWWGMVAGDLQKILQPVDQLYQISTSSISEIMSLIDEIESGGASNWTAAFARPDPLDPNDRVRQKTQSRLGDYPYDRSISYGAPQGTDLGGGGYQRPPDLHPPNARRRRPGDVIPYGQRGTAWEQLEDLTDPYQNGPQADDAKYLGYGNMGRMGDGLDPEELDMDALRMDFRRTFVDTLPVVRTLNKTDLFSLLADLDPEYSAELFAPDEDDEMQSIYADWGRRVYAPGAEDDRGTEYVTDEDNAE